MTKEESAEEYAEKKAGFYSSSFEEIKEAIKTAFLKGFEKGIKSQWHDLRKNPNDLPKDNQDVLVILWEAGHYYIGYYEEEYDDVIKENTYWHFGEFDFEKSKLENVLAWIELPKFKEN